MPRYSRIFTTPQSRHLAVVAGLLAAAGCGSPPVSSELNSAVPIPAGATVAFRGSTSNGLPQANSTVSNDSVHHMIRRAITAQLRQKGYTVVDSSQPSTFTLRYLLAVSSTVAYPATGGGVSGPPINGYGLGYGRTQDTPLTGLATAAPIKNVLFEVSLVDERAGRTAWRGLFQREPKSQAPSEKRINEVVAEVFTTAPKVP